MSSMTFGQKSFKVKPPDKGSFPLDHDGKCKDPMTKYMRCLREKDMDNTACRDLSKQYLSCRMEHGLMTREDWKHLGYNPEQKSKSTAD